MSVPTGFARIGVDANIILSAKGSITVKTARTQYAKYEYNFSSNSWDLVKQNGNSSRNGTEKSLDLKGEAKFGINVTITAAVFELVRVLQAEFEAGVKATAVKSFESDPDSVPCAVVQVGLYADTNVYLGAWAEFGKEKKSDAGTSSGALTIGSKVSIFSRSYSNKDLTGRDPLLFHISLKYGCHMADNCPYGDRVTVEFETHTSQLIDPVLVYKNAPIPSRPVRPPRSTTTSPGAGVSRRTSSRFTAPTTAPISIRLAA